MTGPVVRRWPFLHVFKLFSWIPHEWLAFTITPSESFEPVYHVDTLYLSEYCLVPVALVFWNKFCFSVWPDLENRCGVGGLWAFFFLKKNSDVSVKDGLGYSAVTASESQWLNTVSFFPMLCVRQSQQVVPALKVPNWWSCDLRCACKISAALKKETRGPCSSNDVI